MKLSIYLLKEEVRDFDDAIKDGRVYDQYSLDEAYDYDGVIVIGEIEKKIPDWVEFLNSEGSLDMNLEEYYNQSTRGIIMVRVSTRILAFTFGFGRFLLKDYAIEKDFGIKVVLNSVDPDKLKGVDKTKLNENMIQSRQQALKDITINEFDFDKMHDFVKRVAGKALDDELGVMLDGSESLHLNYELELEGINGLATTLYHRYDSKSYKRYFPWYDNMQIVKDKDLLVILNQILVKAIIEEDDIVQMNIPDILDDLAFDSMKFTQGGTIYDFEIASIKKFYEDNDKEITMENLKKRNAIFPHEEEPYSKKIYSCITMETIFEDSFYVLFDSQWFKIAKGFKEEIDNYIDKISICDLTFVNCKNKETEGAYTIRCCDETDSFYNMDRKLVDKVEVCDILTNEGEFIHIKPWKSSATLSHLFSQGRIAGTLMLQDTTFREKVYNQIKDKLGLTQIINIGDFKASDYEIVYAIIYTGDKTFSERLPFFSKLNLKQSVDILLSMGYKVSIKHIKKLID